jgi:hypothetical protein
LGGESMLGGGNGDANRPDPMMVGGVNHHPSEPTSDIEQSHPRG